MTEIKRRTLVKGSAWAAPAVLVAEAAAQAATSPNDIIPVAQMYMKMRGTPENINAAGVAAGRKGLTCTEIGGWPYAVNGVINWNDTLGGGRATNDPNISRVGTAYLKKQGVKFYFGAKSDAGENGLDITVAPGGAELDPSRIVSTKVMFLLPKAAYGDTPTFTNISSSNEGGHPWDSWATNGSWTPLPQKAMTALRNSPDTASVLKKVDAGDFTTLTSLNGTVENTLNTKWNAWVGEYHGTWTKSADGLKLTANSPFAMALTLNQTGLSQTLTRLIFMPVFVITYRMPNGKLVYLHRSSVRNMYWQLTVTGNPGLDDSLPAEDGKRCPVSARANDHI